MQALKRETHGKNCIQVMLKVQSMSCAHAALPAQVSTSSRGTEPMRSIAAVPDSFPAGIPFDPEQAPQPLLIPEDPDIGPDTRMPEPLKSAV